MHTQAFAVDHEAITITVRDARLFNVTESVADSLGFDLYSRIDDTVVVYCENVDDLALLGLVLADRAQWLVQ